MMKTGRIITVLFVCFAILPGLTYAGENDGTEDIFNFGTGARAMGMGRTFVGLADDASTIYWNPAGLYNIDKKTLSLFYAQLFQDTLYGFLGYVHPTVDYGTFGAAVLTLSTGGIPEYDSDSVLGDLFSSTKMKLLIGYANRLPWLPLTIGVNFKLNLSSMYGNTATSANMDIGLMFDILKADFRKKALEKTDSLDDELVVGFIFKNLFFKTGEKLYLSEDHANFEIKLGVSYLHYFGSDIALRGLIDLQFYEQRDLQLSFGSELTLARDYFIRLGYTFDSGLSFGAGVRLAGWNLDYALVFRPLGGTHNFSISWSFGDGRMDEIRRREKAIQERIRSNVRKQTEKQKKEFDTIIKKKDEQYTKTIEQKDKKIADITRQREKDLKEAEQRIADLQRRRDEEVEAYKKRLDSTIKKNEALINSLKEQRKKDVERIRTEMRQQLEQMQTRYADRIKDLEQRYSSRIKTISRTNTVERARLKQRFQVEKEKLKQDETRKSKEYSQGVEAYNKGNYQEALKYFNRVRGMDPRYADVQKYILRIQAQKRDVRTYSKRIMDFYRKGVKLYLKRNYKEAIAVWQEILKIDPYNKLATRNIEMAKKRLKAIEDMRK